MYGEKNEGCSDQAGRSATVTGLSPKEIALQSIIQDLATQSEINPLQVVSLSGFHAPRVPRCLFDIKSLSTSLVTLDISRNEIRDLPPEIGMFNSLVDLDVSRNFLRSLPSEVRNLLRLVTLNASSNDLRLTSLNLEALSTLPAFKTFDLRHNNHIWEPSHEELLSHSLVGVSCPVTLRPQKKQKLHAADRDATHLHSQLAPLCTGTLRRRLSLVFGDTTDPETVSREEVMERLLSCYGKLGPRAVRHVEGTRVSDDLCDALLDEMVTWATEDEKRTLPRERLTINAAHYMIVTSPKGFTTTTGAKAVRAREKLAAHAKMWDLAKQVLEEADPEFAARYTAVAFTKNFVGSPHIDTQNIATFRALALGDFRGGGALAVECSAREVAHVDTKKRLGKADGRFPHWVEPYEGDRYSVIFYQTMGAGEERTTAVFSDVPPVVADDPTTYCNREDKYYNRYCRKTKTYSPSS